MQPKRKSSHCRLIGERGASPGSAAAVLAQRCRVRPRLAVILGSSFMGAGQDLAVEAAIDYGTLPGFPQPTVTGHVGKLLAGHFGNTPVLVLSGRAHFYEGLDMRRVTFAVRTLADFGIKDLILTNAAGGINPRLSIGDFMILVDHINFMGANPLVGPEEPGMPRFVDMTTTYDSSLRALLRKAGRLAGVRTREGVYLAVSGPSYETPAEIRAFARLGADAVGMSTVPEAIVARQCGMRVVGVSCITNLAAGRHGKSLSHHEVLETGHRVGTLGAKLLRAFAELYGRACGNEVSPAPGRQQ